MEVNDGVLCTAQMKPNIPAGPHAFIPYESPLHKSKGPPLGNYPIGSSDDDKCRDKDITKALNKFPHSNRVGPQSLTSGWEYYQWFPLMAKSAFQALDPKKEHLPPLTGKHRWSEFSPW